jgi:hypothetical protein
MVVFNFLPIHVTDILYFGYYTLERKKLHGQCMFNCLIC